MNTLLLAITAISLLVLIALVLIPRRDEPADMQPAEDERISPLLRGINYLLSDEPDRALQEMVQVARLRSEAAEVYMALGEMFRAKGEYGRAVRIHQNLLARPDLPATMRVQAMFALARDFHAGGLLDRALQHYRKVLDMRSDHVESLEASLRIREQSSEWLLAEELLSRLEQVRGASYGSHRAYLFAEVAVQALKSGRDDEAVRYATRALELDSTCAPARMVMVERGLKEGDFKAVDVATRTLFTSNPEHFPLLLPVLLRHKKFAARTGKALLLELWRQNGSEEMALAWLEAVAERDGREPARALASELAYSPSSLRAALRLQAATGDSDDAEFARDWRSSVKNYVCELCGVEVKVVRWQCPQCHAWGTMHPIKGGMA